MNASVWNWPAVILFLLLFMIAACDSTSETPPTEIVVVTGSPSEQPFSSTDEAASALATADTRIASLEETIVAQQATIDSLSVEVNPTEPPREPVETQITLTPYPTATELPGLFPTPRVEQIVVVEQLFENGRMVWFRDTRSIWVLAGEEGQIDPMQGSWYCFMDTFEEGEPETLPEFDPPEGQTSESIYSNEAVTQPIRGFGKIWRENDNLRQLLGWALTRELEHVARRDYVAGGRVIDDEYVPGPGEWRLNSFFGGTLVFLEDEMNFTCNGGTEAGTWTLRRQ